MFCKRCGAENQDESHFCIKCGSSLKPPKVEEVLEELLQEPPKVMLDPDEVVNHEEEKDSSKSFSGTGTFWGYALITISILIDVIALITISAGGYELFAPMITVGTIMFVLGWFLKMHA